MEDNTCGDDSKSDEFVDSHQSASILSFSGSLFSLISVKMEEMLPEFIIQ